MKLVIFKKLKNPTKKFQESYEVTLHIEIVKKLCNKKYNKIKEQIIYEWNREQRKQRK